MENIGEFYVGEGYLCIERNGMHRHFVKEVL